LTVCCDREGAHPGRVINPATEQTLTDVPDAAAGDVSDALGAAARVWPDWGEASPNERAGVLRKIAARLDAQRDRLAAILTDEVGKPIAEAEGEAGGGRLTGGVYEQGYWMAQTVLTDVDESMPAMTDELFGPVTPISSFRDWADVRDRANATRYGLSAYVYTSDLGSALRASRELSFGEVYINRVGPEEINGFHVGYRESRHAATTARTAWTCTPGDRPFTSEPEAALLTFPREASCQPSRSGDPRATAGNWPGCGSARTGAARRTGCRWPTGTR
jgi:acyl-CoA reductase-like NAD-dependent aldehyde dehydrogenase